MSACVESAFSHLSPAAVSQPTASTAPLRADPAANVAGPMPCIVHVALDSFFASVEQVLNPKLLGRPVLVGRKALASVSAEARMMGVLPSMTLAEALEVCPNAVVVPGRYGKYAEYAERVRRILETYTAKVEAGSRDDFYLYFSGTETRNSDVRGTLLGLQMDVFDQTGLSVSLGAASTRVVAEIASQIDGPRGLRIVPPGSEQRFLAPISVSRVPGLGPEYASMFRFSGIQTIAELRRVPLPSLEVAFGGLIGRRMWDAARGRDTREKLPTAPPNSVSRETTIDEGTTDSEHLNRMIGYLCERVGAALAESGREARSIGIGITYVDQYSAKQSKRLATPTSAVLDLHEAARDLCMTLFTRQVKVHRIRVEIAAGVAKADSLQSRVDTPELALAASL
jgi:DNA polymerase-4